MRASPRLAVFAGLATLLGSVVLRPVFERADWIWPATAVIAVVAVVGEAGRRLHLPRPVVPLVSAAALVVTLSLIFARHEATFGILPDRSGFAPLVRLVRSGLRSVQEYATPVPLEPGLVFLAVGGIGVVAIAVDTLAVTYGRASIAGLPLLALYAVPAAVVEGGVSTWLFLVMGAGWIALLVAEGRDRVSGWGRPVGVGDVDRRPRRLVDDLETSPLVALGRRIGVASLALAVVVPALIPGLDEGVLGTGRSGDGPGGRTITTVNPIVSLKQDLERDDPVEVLSYRLRGNSRDYLRLVTLDIFDGTSWKTSDLKIPSSQRVSGRTLPQPEGLRSTTAREEVVTQVRVTEALRSEWLPVRYPPVRIDVPGDWRYDRRTRNIISPSRRTDGLRYEMVSLELSPTRQQLRAAGPAPQELITRYTALPPLPSRVEALARQVVGDAPTAYDQAMALQDWFTGDFAYSIDVRSGNSTRLLLDFLDKKIGYCEQFAAAMAVMARLLGIPARVNVGYTPGDRQQDGTYVVTSFDAHAWPELFFAGVGWVRFEPTPLGDGRGITPSWARPEPVGGGPGGAEDDPATAGGDPGAAPVNPRPADGRPIPGSADGAPITGPVDEGLPVWPLYVLAALLVLAAVPPLARRLTRRLRWRRARTPQGRAAAAWAELRDDARDLGYGWRESQTPRQAAARLGEGLGEGAREALARVAETVERARFAAAAPAGATLAADVGTVRSGLAAAAGRRRRWRARLLPVSVRDLLTLAGERIADGLDALDRLGAITRARLLRRGRRASL